jgi:hypothetical protein
VDSGVRSGCLIAVWGDLDILSRCPGSVFWPDRAALFRCDEDAGGGVAEPSSLRVQPRRLLGLLALCLLVPMTSLASAYDDHGRNYRVPATNRWKQEWLDAFHHKRSAWQEGEAHDSVHPAISVCVTYYAAPYNACEGQAVDWYWGNVGRRSGYLTAVDVRCPRCRHRVWGLFRRVVKPSANTPNAQKADVSSRREVWPLPTPASGTLPFGDQLDWGLPQGSMQTTAALREAQASWHVNPTALRQTASEAGTTAFTVSGRRSECLLVILRAGLGTVLGCTSRWLADRRGVWLELQGVASTIVIGALPPGTSHAEVVNASGEATPVTASTAGGFIEDIRGSARSLAIATHRGAIIVPLVTTLRTPGVPAPQH